MPDTPEAILEPGFQLLDFRPGSRLTDGIPLFRRPAADFLLDPGQFLNAAFKDGLSRYRSGHGAKNMATVRRFALGLVRANKSKGSVKTRRKAAGWSPDFLLDILQLKLR